ncbi:hypothetical protein ES703_101699 [subsurface metagenome]
MKKTLEADTRLARIMDKWRPKNWKNPHPHDRYSDTCDYFCHDSFEAGADAILEGLNKMPVQVHWTGDGKGGVVFDIDPAPVIDEWCGYTLVFIPD